MSVEIKVPTVGESITEVTVANWTKKEGDFVNQDEVICELESDKATFELNAPESGILHIKAQAGETLPVGGLVCVLEKTAVAGSDAASVPEKVDKVVAKTGEVKEMKVPAVGESITEVTIANWFKKNGDYVNLDEVLCEIESDKATFELPAESAGILEILAEAGKTLQIGESICKIVGVSGDAAGTNLAKAEEKSEAKSKETASTTLSSATPVAAKILADKGISADAVKGSGPGGKVTKEDALKAEKSAPALAEKKDATPAETKVLVGDREVDRQKMSSLRKTVARRLVSVKNETAMLTTFNEVDMKPVMDIRARYKDKFKEKHEVGLGFMSFFTKAVCAAMKDFPVVNAMIDGDEIIYNRFVDVSIAVSAPKGLVVPVIRNAEKRSFADIEKEVVRLATRARDNKLTIEEMTGGTFTITNGGVFGSMLSTPIINAPQSAILGMHNIVERPVAINGEVVVRPIMYVALSYDHRIIDGRESVGFLVKVKQLLEDPTRLLLDI